MKEPVSKSARHFYSFGAFRLYVIERELFRGGEPVTLPPKIFGTLLLLLRRHGHVVDKDELIRMLWPDTFVEEDNLVQQVSHLRKALGQRPDGGSYVETVARRGYRFAAPVTESWEEEPAEPRVEVVGEIGPEARPAGQWRRRVWLLAAVCVRAVGVTGWLLFLRPGRGAREAVLTAIPVTSYPGNETRPSFSPDGSQVAFSWRRERDDDYDIYVKVVGSGEPLQLTGGPDSDIAPAWSPDGRQIAFYRQSKNGVGIYWVSPLGGSERHLADLSSSSLFSLGYAPALLSWSPDSKTLAFQEQKSVSEPESIYSLSLETGEKKRLTSPPLGWLGDGSPAFSPDGRTVAFVRFRATEIADLYLVPAGGGEPDRLTFDHSYTHGLAWTADGREIVFSSHRAGECNLWRVSASGGKPQRVEGIGGHDHFPAISRQARRLIFDRYTEDVDIWRVEAPDSKGAAKPAAKLIASTRYDADPEYSPDGTQIAFTSDRSGAMQVWLCNSDGSNPVQLTSFGAELSSWSPDGQYIAFNSLLKGNWDIYVISAKGGAARQLTTHRAEDCRPSWSRDGRWIYFSSTRTGAFQVWKVPAEGGTPVQVTKNGGHRPIESVDGKFLYYAKGREVQDVWRVPAQGGEEVLILPVKRQQAWTTVVENGLYFFDQEEGATFGSGWWIKFFDFRTGHTRPVVALDEDRVVSDISPYSGSPAVSLDGRSFLYTPMDLGESDLMLVENFR